MPSRVDAVKERSVELAAGDNHEKSNPLEGLYRNKRMAQMVTQLIGATVRIRTKHGKTYEGILEAISPLCEIALRIAFEKKGDLDEEMCVNQSDTWEQMSFEPENIVELVAVTEFETAAKNFHFESELSRSRVNGDAVDREFVAWEPDHEDGDPNFHSPSHDQADASSGWSVDEMFKKNQEIGVVSTYTEDMMQYSTVHVDKGDESSEEYRMRLREAERMAKEIEANPASKLHAALENEDEERDLISGAPTSGNWRTSGPGPLPAGSGISNSNSPSSNKFQKRGGERRGRGGPRGSMTFSNSRGLNRGEGGSRDSPRFGGPHEHSPGAYPANVHPVQHQQRDFEPDNSRNRKQRSLDGKGFPSETYPRQASSRHFPREHRDGRKRVDALRNWGENFKLGGSPDGGHGKAGGGVGSSTSMHELASATSPTPRMHSNSSPQPQRDHRKGHRDQRLDSGEAESRAGEESSSGRNSSGSVVLVSDSTSPSVGGSKAQLSAERTPEHRAPSETNDDDNAKKFLFNPDAPEFTPRGGGMPGQTAAITPTPPTMQQQQQAQMAAYPAPTQSPASAAQPPMASPMYPVPSQTAAGVLHMYQQPVVSMTAPYYVPPAAAPPPVYMVSATHGPVPVSNTNHNANSNNSRPRKISGGPVNVQQTAVMGHPLQIGQFPGNHTQQYHLLQYASASQPPYPAQPQYYMTPRVMQSGSTAYVADAQQAMSYGTGPTSSTSSVASHSNNASLPPTPGPQPTQSPAYPPLAQTPQSPQFPAPPSSLYPQTQGQMVMVMPGPGGTTAGYIPVYGAQQHFAAYHPSAAPQMGVHTPDAYAHQFAQAPVGSSGLHPSTPLLRSASVPGAAILTAHPVPPPQGTSPCLPAAPFQTRIPPPPSTG